MPVTIAGSGTLTGINPTSLAGEWTAYTPTLSAESGTFTTASATARYVQVGKQITLSFQIVITTVGTATGQVRVSLPTAMKSANPYSIGSARERAATGAMCQVARFDDSTVFVLKYDNTTIAGSGREIVGTYVYEAA